MTIPGHDQVSLEKQREGRANGTTGVRRERGIREKAHDETGILKKEIAGGEELGEDFLLYKNYFYIPDHPLLLVKGKVFFFIVLILQKYFTVSDI